MATEARPINSAAPRVATPCRTGRPMPGRTWLGNNLRAGWGIAARVQAQVIGTWATAELAPAPAREMSATAVERVPATGVEETVLVTSEFPIVLARLTAARLAGPAA
jgi:hypothetical protein